MYEIGAATFIVIMTTSLCCYCWRSRSLRVTKSTFVSDVLGTQVDITRSVARRRKISFGLLPEDITDVATDGRIITSYRYKGRPYKLISYEQQYFDMLKAKDRTPGTVHITPEFMAPDAGTVFVSVENGKPKVVTDAIMEYAGPDKDFGASWTPCVVKIKAKDLAGGLDLFVLGATDTGVLETKKIDGDTIIQASYS